MLSSPPVQELSSPPVKEPLLQGSVLLPSPKLVGSRQRCLSPLPPLPLIVASQAFDISPLARGLGERPRATQPCARNAL